MKKAAIFLLVISVWSGLVIQAQPGTWRVYPAYRDVTQIEKAGNLLYVLASGGLYAYNTADQSILTFDKAKTLHDTDVRHIAWCETAKRLVAVYANQNIDLLQADGSAVNMPDYLGKSVMADKTVNDIYVHNRHAYLSTGFGIIKLDVGKAEISDTYSLGFAVDHAYIEGGRLYAASPGKGLYSVALDANPADKNNWTRVGEYAAKSRMPDADLLKTVNALLPGGPKHNHFGVLRFAGGRLYTAGGGYLAVADAYRDGTIQVWDGSDWQIYDSDIQSKTGHVYQDIMALDVDPGDKEHVMAGSRGGLYEFRNGRFVKEWSFDNSPLKSVYGTDKDYVIVKGVKYDRQGNLWALNSYVPSQSILKYDDAGRWSVFHKQELMQNTERSLHHMTGMVEDSRSNLWFVNDYWERAGLFCYRPSSDGLLAFQTFNNQDGARVELTSTRCVSEDIDGNIWVGTNMGPLMLGAGDVGDAGAVFRQPKIPRNDGTDFADYLLSGVDITAMAVDGAGRKWFGTNGNGVYLISRDNMTQVRHFTAENSVLLSNVVEAIALNPVSGEVFFGTDKGLCSYRSDASAAREEMTRETVWAYPNPVTPDYRGLITVTGLTLDADVKIVTADGTLVAEGRSLGGFFTWDGNDRKGRRVASGVYMVQTAMADGGKGTVCKIAVVN